MTDEQLEQARTMRSAGTSYSAIGKTLGIPRTTLMTHLAKGPPKPTFDLVLAPDDPYEIGPNALDQLPPDDCEAEVRILRRYLQKAIKDGAGPTVIGDLCTKLSQMTKVWQAAAIRGNRMLGTQTIMEMANEIVRLVCDNFSDVPDFNERIDRVLAGIARLEPANSQSTINKLLGRHQR